MSIGFAVHPLWGADETPRLPGDGSQPSHTGYFPPPGGIRFGITTIPPDPDPRAMDDLELGAVAAEFEDLLPGLARYTGKRVPFWYHIGMSIQIAVRLPDDMMRFVDQLVERGRGSSRAAVIARALDRERRHEMAVQDAAIYAESGEDADMVDLVQCLSGHPVDPGQ